MTRDPPSDAEAAPPIDQETKNVIEAALYVAGRPLTLKQLGSVIRTRSKRKVRRVVEALIADYARYTGTLEVVELPDERFALRLKPRFLSYAEQIARPPLLSAGQLKTLSFIAYHQPVLQSTVVAARGSHVYQHIRDLVAMGLITTAKHGRTKEITVTETFLDYFQLPHDTQELRTLLQRRVPDVAPPP
jgi:segregation and condensation protein B